MAASPGGLASVVQAFSMLDIRAERLDYQVGRDHIATVLVKFVGDQAADLLYRKLTKLIEVIAVEITSDAPEPALSELGGMKTCT